MQYVVRVTKELTTEDWEQLRDLFNEAFQRKVSIEWFLKKYRSPVIGISCYHGLMLNEEGVIVGAMTIIPFQYHFFEQRAIFGNLVDLMIYKDHRNNILNFKFIYDKLIEASRPLIHFIYAVPNLNSFHYFIKVLKWEEIGKLNYYLWPIKISKLSKLPKVFDCIFVPLMNIFQLFLPTIESKRVISPIRKILSSGYDNYRYSDNYKVLKRGDKIAWYRVYDEKGVNTAYIIDASPMESKWLSVTVKTILKNEKENIDLIMYISNSNLGIWNILKAPQRFQPRSLALIGKLINSEQVDERIFEMGNWTFNLSDFDVR